MTFEKDLADIGERDVAQLVCKDKEYGSSWKRRGGVGAYMMLARKWDRLEEQVKKYNWDVFAAIEADQREEGLLDDLGDLRRYCLLVEGEIIARRRGAAQGSPPDLSRILVGSGQEHPFGFDAAQDAPPYTREAAQERRSGFDLGNGHAAKSGDKVTVHGKRATLIAVLQDGDADVTFDDGTGATVKWREVMPMVGYAKPPIAKRFRKGRSGNPNGRPPE